MTVAQVHRIAERLSPDNPTRAVFESELGKGFPAPLVALSIAQQQKAVVTYTLIGLNTLIFLFCKVLPGVSMIEAVDLIGGLTLRGVARGQVFRLLSACFLHHGTVHLAMNMVALVGLGTLCELRYGRVRFLLLYLLSGLGGSMVGLLLNVISGRDAISAGASGALFGLMGAAAVFPFRAGRVLPAEHLKTYMWQILPLVVLNLYITFTVSGISIGGHIGGLLVGLIVGAFLGSPVLDPWHLWPRATRAAAGLVGVLIGLMTLQWGMWLVKVFTAV